MLSPEMPDDEVLRQQILDDQDLLDTPADPYLDTLVRVAREVFAVKTVLVSLIDRDRQWFKARIGLDVIETPRAISFCGHAILATQPFIVEDTHSDPRFHDNPLVLNNPQIRFYAGRAAAVQGRPTAGYSVPDRPVARRNSRINNNTCLTTWPCIGGGLPEAAQRQ